MWMQQRRTRSLVHDHGVVRSLVTFGILHRVNGWKFEIRPPQMPVIGLRQLLLVTMIPVRYWSMIMKTKKWLVNLKSHRKIRVLLRLREWLLHRLMKVTFRLKKMMVVGIPNCKQHPLQSIRAMENNSKKNQRQLLAPLVLFHSGLYHAIKIF